MRPLIVAVLIALLGVGCAPRATLASPDAGVLTFVELPTYNLEVRSPGRNMLSLHVDLTGYQLEVESPFCDLPDCAQDEYGFISLTYPEEEDANLGQRVLIEIKGGLPLSGKAYASIEGLDNTYPADLELLTD